MENTEKMKPNLNTLSNALVLFVPYNTQQTANPLPASTQKVTIAASLKLIQKLDDQ